MPSSTSLPTLTELVYHSCLQHDKRLPVQERLPTASAYECPNFQRTMRNTATVLAPSDARTLSTNGRCACLVQIASDPTACTCTQQSHDLGQHTGYTYKRCQLINN